MKTPSIDAGEISRNTRCDADARILFFIYFRFLSLTLAFSGDSIGSGNALACQGIRRMQRAIAPFCRIARPETRSNALLLPYRFDLY